MKADFETFAAAIAFIVNGAGVATLWSLLQRNELKQIESDLSEEIKTKTADYGYVMRLRGKLRSELFSLWLFPLHFINFGILLSLVVVLAIGPENIFSTSTASSLAEPLLLWEKVLYWIWFALCTLAYVAKGFSPTSRLLSLFLEAGRWLRDNEPKKKNIQRRHQDN